MAVLKKKYETNLKKWRDENDDRVQQLIEKYDSLIQGAEFTISTLLQEEGDIKRQISDIKDRHKKSSDAPGKQILLLQEELNILDAKCKEFEKSHKDLKSYHDKRQEDLTVIEARKQEVEKKFISEQKVIASEGKFKIQSYLLAQKKSLLEETLSDLSRNEVELLERLDKTNKERDECQRIRDAKSKEAENIQVEIELKLEEIKRAEKRLKETRDLLQKIKIEAILKGIANKQNISELEEEKKKLEDSIAELERLYQELCKRRDEATAKEREYGTKFMDIEVELSSLKAEIAKQVATNSGRIREKKLKLENLKAQLSSHEQSRDTTVATLVTLQKDIVELTNTYKKIYDKLPGVEDKYNKMSIAVKEKEKQKKKILDEKQELIALSKSKDNEIRRLEKELEEKQAEAIRLRNLKEEAKNSDVLLTTKMDALSRQWEEKVRIYESLVRKCTSTEEMITQMESEEHSLKERISIIEMKEIYPHLQTEIQQLYQEIEQISQQITGRFINDPKLSELRKSVDEKKAKLQSARTKKLQIETELKSVSLNLTRSETDYLYWRKQYNEFSLQKGQQEPGMGALKSELEKVSSQIVRNQQQYRSLCESGDKLQKELDKLQEQFSDVSSQLPSITAQFNSSQEQFQKIERELVDLRNQLQERTTARDKLVEILKDYERRLRERAAQHEQLLLKVSDLQKEVNDNNAKITVLKVELDSKQKEVVNFEHLLKESNIRVEESKKEISEVRSKLDVTMSEIELKRNECKELQQKTKDVTLTIKNTQDMKKEVESQIGVVVKDIEKIKVDKELLMKDYDIKQAMLKSLISELEEINQKKDKLTVDVANLEDKIAKSKSNKSSLEISRTSLEKELEMRQKIQKKKADLKKEQEKYQETNQKVVKETAELEKMKRNIVVLKENLERSRITLSELEDNLQSLTFQNEQDSNQIAGDKETQNNLLSELRRSHVQLKAKYDELKEVMKVSNEWIESMQFLKAKVEERQIQKKEELAQLEILTKEVEELENQKKKQLEMIEELNVQVKESEQVSREHKTLTNSFLMLKHKTTELNKAYGDEALKALKKKEELLKAEKSALEVENERSRKRFEGLKEELDQLKNQKLKELSKIKQLISVENTLRAEKLSDVSKLESIYAEILELENQRATNPQAFSVLQSKYSDLNKELEVLAQQPQRTLTDRIREISEMVDIQDKQTEELKKQKKNCTQNIIKLQSELSSLEKDKIETESYVMKLKSDIEALQFSIDSFPVLQLQNAKADLEKERNSYQEVINNIREQVFTLGGNTNLMEEDKEYLKMLKSDNSRANREKEGLEKIRNGLKSELDGYKIELDETEKEIALYTKNQQTQTQTQTQTETQSQTESQTQSQNETQYVQIRPQTPALSDNGKTSNKRPREEETVTETISFPNKMDKPSEKPTAESGTAKKRRRLLIPSAILPPISGEAPWF
eukprot:TRINITY_DN1754_c0_g1_i1.p1 TRINITY_DN1754_c0_g1~~TRINITY_DN1754_c0_g1_i1.p1  ORF type:complete len:1561 (-),score=527.15 TRINITY_DN1754_c0_g1_i1:1093-5433(-)